MKKKILYLLWATALLPVTVSAQQQIESLSGMVRISILPDKNAPQKADQQELSVKPGLAYSDVDINIPVTSYVAENTFALIIANENYRREEAVAFAHNDGRIFKEYCRKTLGIPEKHIHTLQDATLNDMKHEFAWITEVMETFNGDAKVLIYYAGHGMPDEASGMSYLLPTDGYSADCATGLSLDRLYKQLGSVPAKSVTYFIDACFSGSKRDDGMLAQARGVAIKAKEGRLSGNAVSFSASVGDQTAYPYKEKKHGLFTYYLLKKLQETSGDVSYQELGEYVNNMVARESLINNARKQTPSISASIEVGTKWHKWKFNE